MVVLLGDGNGDAVFCTADGTNTDEDIGDNWLFLVCVSDGDTVLCSI